MLIIKNLIKQPPKAYDGREGCGLPSLTKYEKQVLKKINHRSLKNKFKSTILMYG